MRSRILFVLVVCSAALALTAPPLVASSNHGNGVAVLGGGHVNAVDDFGGYFADAGSFALLAGVSPWGRAFGGLAFVGDGDFAAAWGACPYDPRCKNYPNTSTKIFHLSGSVSSVTSVGGSVAIAGTLTEVDYGKGNGVVFREENVPFLISATEGSKSFVLKFCEVPPFTMTVSKGTMHVKAGTLSAGLLRRSQVAIDTAMPCHAPVQ